MGILKNDVGRPSNKTIMIRKIIGVVAGIIVIGLIVGICFLLSNPNTKNSGEHKTKVTNQKQEEQPSNIKKCDVKKTSVEGDSEIAVVKNKMSYWTVGGYPYFENKELDSKTIPTYAKISTALYSLGYFESDAVNKINEDGCYIDKKEIDEELANIYSDIKYDPTEFLGNDCLPYKFSYDSKNERFTVINSAAGGCGDASGVIEKNMIKKKIHSKLRFYMYIQVNLVI